jgi:CubicO group peptidase (beta-lactamase class C family)
VEGVAAPGYEGVAAELEHIVAAGGLGASFAAVVDGEPVVDLWGGLADAAAGAPWREDTLALVFSGTKGLVATCLLLLLERGLLELDAPVARYWPEFAAAGKKDVLVRHVVSHTAGVPGLRGGITTASLCDGEALARRVAAEEPFWEPGTTLAYHALTYGAICDKLIRGADGRSTGRFFAEEVAAPLALELWIGLPAELEPRVARLEPADDYRVTYLGDEPEPLLESVYAGLAADGFPWNDRAYHEAEIPSANAIGTTRSLARLYGCLARGGELDGVRLLAAETVAAGARALVRDLCVVTRRPYAFGVGFELQTELGRFGPPKRAFGHTGSGGSSHGAWLEDRVGFSFVTNDLWPEARDDRAPRLLRALADAVSARRR